MLFGKKKKYFKKVQIDGANINPSSGSTLPEYGFASIIRMHKYGCAFIIRCFGIIISFIYLFLKFTHTFFSPLLSKFKIFENSRKKNKLDTYVRFSLCSRNMHSRMRPLPVIFYSSLCSWAKKILHVHKYLWNFQSVSDE